MSKQFWDKEIMVKEVPTGKAVLKTKITEKDGKQYIDLRKFVADKASGEYTQHTTHGISIEADAAVLKGMIASLQKALSEVQKRGVGA